MDTNNPRELELLKKYAKLLDSQFIIPGTNFRFGIDPLLNLIPILGSYKGLVMGFIFILLSFRVGAKGNVLVRMIGNVIFDYLIGAIPFLGQFADFFLKSNERNLKLLEAHYIEGKYSGSGKGLLLIFLIIFSLVTFALIYISIILLKQGFKFIENF